MIDRTRKAIMGLLDAQIEEQARLPQQRSGFDANQPGARAARQNVYATANACYFRKV
jgi:hypothetical protein